MALTTRISVRDETNALIAKFVYSDDAKVFAEAATEREPGRVLTIESPTEGQLYVVHHGIAGHSY